MSKAFVLGIALSLLAAGDKGCVFTFSKDDGGKTPAGWIADKTGKGEGSVWKVVEDATAPSKKGYVLAQTAAGPNALFNLCVVNDTSYQDVEATVSFKPMKGQKDQGGGIVWRYQDANNYYIARFNPLEDNFRVYKVVAGKRSQLATQEELKAEKDTWHTLGIRMTGGQIVCRLNGKEYLKAKDDTFTKAGKVGLWTKADAQTYFDEFKVSGK